MDFLKAFDARGAAETAREMELRDQSTGEIITNGGKPCIVLVKGASSRTIQAALREDEIARAKKAKAAKDAGGEVDTQTAEDLHQATCKAASRFIAGFKNMQTVGEDGKARDLTADDIPAFIDLTFISLPHLMREKGDDEWRKPSFAQQVLDFAQDDAAFLAKSAKA